MPLTNTEASPILGLIDKEPSVNQSITVTSESDGLGEEAEIVFANPVLWTILSSTNFPTSFPDNFFFVKAPNSHGAVYMAQQFAAPTYQSLLDIPDFQLSDSIHIISNVPETQFTATIFIQYIFDIDDPILQDQGTFNDFIHNLVAGQVGGLEGAGSDLLTALLGNFLQPIIAIGTELSSLISELSKENQTLSAGVGDVAAIIQQQFGTSFGQDIPGLVTQLTNILSAGTGIPDSILQPLIQALVNALLSVITDIETDISNATSIGGKHLFDALNVAATNIFSVTNLTNNLLNDLVAGKFTSMDSLYTTIQRNSGNSYIIQFLQNTFAIFYLIFAYVKAKSAPIDISLNNLILSQTTPNIISINEAIQAYFRSELTDLDLTNELGKHGLNQTRINQLVGINRPLPGLEELRVAFQRGIISEQLLDEYLTFFGFADAAIDVIKSVYPVLPSPTDLTRLADKHVFSADIASSFGQNAEIDQGYIDSMSLWGIDEDWTRKLWAGHWSLPGLENVLDMWHRGTITDADLDTYFKLTDVLPFFRDKLKTLGFSLVTRVDIRRLYNIGIYKETDVLNAYLKIGYSPTDATALTQFTVQEETLSEEPKAVKIRTLTEGMVVKAYLEGIISQVEAVTRLGSVGYSANDAILILELNSQTAKSNVIKDKTNLYHDKTMNLILTDYAKGVIGRTDARNYLISIGVPANEADAELYYGDIERITYLKGLIINHVRIAYGKGQISKIDATNLMLGYGFGMSEIDLLFEELDIELMLRNKELTIAQLISLFKAGVIDTPTLATELANMGYNANHVSWLLAEITGVE
jgi:hypothetical protein